jgi:probable DNA metabolism protein
MMRVVRMDGLGFEEWRKSARQLLEEAVVPEAVLWMEEPGLFGQNSAEVADKGEGQHGNVRVPAAFFEQAKTAAAHRSPERWGLLYRIVWRLSRSDGRGLLGRATDPDIRALDHLVRAVRRDIHKMHAFVRFRRVGTRDDREQYVAWFEPDHRIVRLTASFFQRRFTGMDWSILTPDECVHWDGTRLQFTPGVERSAAPDADALEELWRAYYRSIFNPARLKVKAMQSEMPKKYWANLPEAELIGELIAQSRGRVEDMLAAEERPVKPEPRNAYLKSLRERTEGGEASDPGDVS